MLLLLEPGGLLELLAPALLEHHVLDRDRHVHVDRVLVLAVELGERELLDQRLRELATRALDVIEVGGDDRSGLPRPLPLEEVIEPAIEGLRHRHPDLDLDVLVLRLPQLAPAIEAGAVLVGHDVGLDAAALDRLEQSDLFLAVELECEVSSGVGAGLLAGHDGGRL